MSGGSWGYNRFDEFEKHLLGEECGKCGDDCDCDKCKGKKKSSKKGAKPDYLDLDKDGDKEEDMEDAAENVSEALRHRDAKTGEVTDKPEVGKTYYTDGPRQKSSVALRKEKEAAEKKNLKKEDYGYGEVYENRRAARAAGGYKDDSKKQTDPSKDGFTGISGSIKEIMKQNKEIEAANKKATKKEELEATGLFTAEELELVSEALGLGKS